MRFTAYDAQGRRKEDIAGDADTVDGQHASAFAPVAKGVTNGDAHDHSGGDGAQIDHANLANVGTTTHAQLDTHVGNSEAHHAAPTASPTASKPLLMDSNAKFPAHTVAGNLQTDTKLIAKGAASLALGPDTAGIPQLYTYHGAKTLTSGVATPFLRVDAGAGGDNLLIYVDCLYRTNTARGYAGHYERVMVGYRGYTDHGSNVASICDVDAGSQNAGYSDVSITPPSISVSSSGDDPNWLILAATATASGTSSPSPVLEYVVTVIGNNNAITFTEQ